MCDNGAPEPAALDPAVDRRDQLLLKMYDQMMNDIDRHIVVIWQSAAVLVAAFAVFSLVEKKVISLDIATALVVLIGAWLAAHVYDASYWYNRNLVIIANIERQFLQKSDLRDIQYYFGKHRRRGAMLTHLKLQLALGIGICTVLILNHFIARVVPGFGQPWSTLDVRGAVPYVALIVGLILVLWLRRKRESDYREFLDNSPGISVDTEGITYGGGHPT